MPTSISDRPAVQEASKRLSQLRQRKSALEAEFREARLGGRERSVDELADEVYGGGPVTAAETRTAAEVQKELTATIRAIQRARTELHRARNEATEQVLEELRPRYRCVVRRMARHARALLDAAEDELALEEELAAAGVKTLSHREVLRFPDAKLREWLERAEATYDV